MPWLLGRNTLCSHFIGQSKSHGQRKNWNICEQIQWLRPELWSNLYFQITTLLSQFYWLIHIFPTDLKCLLHCGLNSIMGLELFYLAPMISLFLQDLVLFVFIINKLQFHNLLMSYIICFNVSPLPIFSFFLIFSIVSESYWLFLLAYFFQMNYRISLFSYNILLMIVLNSH